MTTAFLSWRNWCSEAGTASAAFGTFEANAPVTNILTPRPAERAIATAIGVAGVSIDVGTDKDSPPIARPVQLVAIIGHNLLSLGHQSDLFLQIRTLTGDFTSPGLPSTAFIGGDGLGFTRVFYWLVPASLPFGVDPAQTIGISFGVGVTAVTGTRDPITGEVTPEPLSIGTVWAGPIWRPTHGFRFDAFAQGVSEIARGARSIGGQFYPNPEPRYREASIEFPLLPEREVYSTDPVAQPSLQQLAAWCAMSRPLIAVPTDSDPELVYAQGIYGYLRQTATWNLRDAAHDGSTKVRSYTGALSITEAL